MSLNNLKSSVRTYLAANFMYVDDEWLTGCIEYLTEDNSTNYTESEVKNLAKEQWLLNDLKDICPGSLPNNLKLVAKTILNGKFVIQINATADIGTPAYQQYLKLQKVNQENVEATTNHEEKIPCHRMIKLYITDGVQDVSAIEYRPMRNINCDITPGCKAILKGPIECRRGVMLLTESNLELLGGEVQELSTNAMPALLAAKLNLPLTIERARDTTSLPRNSVPTPHAVMPSRDDIITESARPVARVTSVQLANFADDDIDVDQLAAIEEQFIAPNTSREGKKPETVKRQSTDDSANAEKRAKVVNAADYPEDEDLFFEDDEYLREMEDKFDNQLNKEPSMTVPSEPFIYIRQINEIPDNDKAGKVFRIKGQIMKLLSKLSVGKDGWSLKCTLVDGTGSIDVDFTSDVLSKLVGYTPQEMNQLKKQMATKPELKGKAVSALQKAKDSLQVLYCIIELTMLEVPKITCLIPFEEAHVDSLKRRTRDPL